MADTGGSVSDKLRRANVANIVSKLQAGKTLSKTEQDALALHEELGQQGEPERLTKRKLAPVLGISRVTLDAYLNRTDPPPPVGDANMEYSVEEVARYISETRGDESKKKGAQYWQGERHRVACEMLVVQLEILRGKYISKDEATRTIAPLMREIAEDMRMEFELKLPAQYKGRDMVECAALNQAAIDKIVTRFRTGMGALVAAA